MSRPGIMTIPARSTLLIALTALILVTAPCWGATGLDNLAGPLRDIAIKAQHGEALPVGPLSVGDEVLVVVQFRSPIAAMVQSLNSFGASVRFRHEERVEALVPAHRLIDIASLPEVVQVRPPNFPIPLQGFGPTLSEGMVLVGGLSFYTAGITGAGVTVGIIDTGFASLDDDEVPIDEDDPSRMVSFRADGGMGTTAHGSAVAEVVADMAPGSEIILIAVDTEMSIASAIDYVMARGLDVAIMSMGLLGGPYDGSHPVSQKVNQARNRGVFFVTGSGNHAQRHWQGTWEDRTRNNVHEFAVGDDSIELFLTPGYYTAHLSWYETAGRTTNRDYDLALYDANNRLVARSGYTQDGTQPPADTLLALIPHAGNYRLRIERMGGPDFPDRFQLFSVGVDIEARHRVPASSLSVPAEALGAYTVGATRGALLGFDPDPDPDDPPPPPIVPIDTLEPFSSQGPVVGHPHRIKPDLVAPNAVRTSLDDEGYSPFMGTSAAAAHVAGAAALLIAENPQRTPSQIELVFRTHAVRLEEPVPNNRTGYGRLNLRVGVDSAPPSITISYPTNSSTITTRTPTIVAFITDEGSGVDPETIVIELNSEVIFDGSAVPNVHEFYDERTGQLAFRIEEPLPRTNHFVLIRASDRVGNAADPAISNFRVVAPSFAAGVSMVSFPYRNLATTDLSIILGMQPADFAMVRWWPLEQAADKYFFYPDARASLTPPDTQQADMEQRTVPYPPAGLGYFLSIPRQAVLDIRGEPLQDVPSSHIRLYQGQFPPRGWNMIGNPYSEAVNWGSVQFETADGRHLDLRAAIEHGITGGILFEFVQGVGDQPGFYDFNPQPGAATLVPGVGYWLHVNEDARVRVFSGDVGATVASDEQGSETASGEGWQLTLSARAGDFVDPRTIIGVKSTASAGYDPQWDVPKPPPLVDGLQMSMYRPNWGAHSGRYARDIRGPGDDASWEIEVVCSLADTEVEITWPDMNAEVPEGIRLVLEDLETGRTVYMRTSNGYRFRTGAEGGVRNLRISTQETGRALAVQSMSAQSVGGGAMITYSVSQASDVSIEVMNIAGRTVRTFPARAVDGGSQETLTWNGVSDRGSSVPSGRYIVQLTALAEDGQTVRAIRPFSVTR